MKTISVLVLGLILSLGAFAQSELDPKNLPQELIVRVDAQGNREVYKVSGETSVTNDQSAEVAVKSFVTAENKLNSAVVAESELDRTTSKDSWFYYYYPAYNYNWSFGYNYYGYNYYYRPYYYWNFGYYNYYYYRYF